MNDPINSTLPAALHCDLLIAADGAVRRRDLSSLNAFRIIGVDLKGALESSVRYGFHEITRGLRNMGVEVRPLAVQFAVAKSAESYWALCAPDGLPVHATEALREAISHARWDLAETLLGKFQTKPTAGIVEQLCNRVRGSALHPPGAVLNSLFDGLDDRELTPTVLEVAAQRLKTPQFERVCERAGRVDLRALLVPAFLAGHMSNFQALLNSGVSPDESQIGRFFNAPRHLKGARQHEELSVAFIETLTVSLGPTLSTSALLPAIERFLHDRMKFDSPVASLTAEQSQAMTARWASAIVNALRTEDHDGLAQAVENVALRLGFVERGHPNKASCMDFLRRLTQSLNEQVAWLAGITPGMSR